MNDGLMIAQRLLKIMEVQGDVTCSIFHLGDDGKRYISQHKYNGVKRSIEVPNSTHYMRLSPIICITPRRLVDIKAKLTKIIGFNSENNILVDDSYFITVIIRKNKLIFEVYQESRGKRVLKSTIKLKSWANWFLLVLYAFNWIE